MTNHLRTLLLNLQAIPSLAGHPLTQFIDPSFVPVALDGPHSAFRSLMLGRDSDRIYSEFVATQLHRLAWANPDCRRIIEAIDPRTTIDPVAGHLRWTSALIQPLVVAGDIGDPAIVSISSPGVGQNPSDDFVLYTSRFSHLDAQRYFELGTAPLTSGSAGTAPVIMGWSKWTGDMGVIPSSLNGSLIVSLDWFSLSLPEQSDGSVRHFMAQVSCRNMAAMDITFLANHFDAAGARAMASLPQTHWLYRQGLDLLAMLSSSDSLTDRLSAAICAYQLSLS